MAGALPTFDEALGAAPAADPNRLPTMDEAFAGSEPSPHDSPALDMFYSDVAKPVGRVLNAFGQGAKQGWGSEPVGYSPAAEDFLKGAGQWGDHLAARGALLKAFNVGVVRPAITWGGVLAGSVTNVLRAGNAGLSAAAGGFREVASEENAGLGADVNVGGGTVGLSTALGYPGEVAAALQSGYLPEASFLPHVPEAVDLPKARSLAVVGEGEGGYFGTVEPHPESLKDRAEAVKQQVAQQPASAPEPTQEGAAAKPATSEPEIGTAPQQPDIHAVARQIAPETFREYDSLTARRDTFRRWVDELSDKRQEDAESNAPHANEIAELQSKMEDATPRLQKKYQARIDEMQPEHDAFIENAVSQDTPDMARVRAELMKADYRMRDLAPDVASAYRKAQEQHPELVETAEAPKPEAAQPEGVPAQAAPQEGETSVQTPDGAQPKIVPAEEAVNPGAPKPEAEAQPQIAADVSKKLVKAGRPKEEADAAAALVQAHYEARAARFGGAKGTAYELYAKEGPNIRAGGVRAKAKELAQGKTLDQSKRGSITLGNARNTIKLFKDADASTFIHETGHDWLEELMRDAADERAPEDLKQDAATVREFIGAKEGGAIPTKGHEKFARSFERYMREGVAPSKELAGVFAKFRDWLTKIYEVMSARRYPINDDIRDVFDRLLAKNPEKTVIAPERTTAHNMAEIHENEAESVEPKDAAETAGRIRGEIEHQVVEKAPEIADDIDPNIASRDRAGGIAETDAGVPGGGDEAGPGPGQAGAADESGTVPAGGNEGAQEGGPVPEQPSADAGRGGPSVGSGNADRGPTGEPTGSNEHFTDPESNLVDKAGNIRLDNLNTPEDVSQVIRDTASDNGGFMSARRGVLTDGEVLDLADALGVNPAFLDGRKLGQAFNAEQVMAARKLLIKSATNLRDLMRKAAGGTDADVMAYAEAKARHIMIQEQVSGITAEAGRALRAFRKIEGSDEAKAVGDFLKDATGRTLNQLREEAKLGASLETPAQVSKYMDDLNKHPFKNAVLEYYINALISGPITHFRYSVGNALNALWTPLVQIPIASGIGAAREALGIGAESNRVYMGEAGAQLYAMMKGSRDGWKAATEAFTTGMSPSLPGERFHAQIPGAIPGKIGEVIRLPGKSVSAIHSFFKSLRYEQNIQGLAYRTAMNEGLTGDAFANRISDLTVRPTPDMMDEAGHLDPAKMDAQHLENVESATQNALKELYMSPTKYDSAMGALNRAVDRSIIAKIIVPFMKIGSQITRNAFIEQTPLGLASSEVRGEFAKGGAAADFQAAKMTGGIALAGITVGLAAEGMATGDGPEDPHQRALWMLNHRPNSITIGDVSIPYQGLGSLGMLMRFSANTYEVAHQIGHEDSGKLAVAFLEGATKSVLDENFMRGVKDALDAIYHPEEYGANYVKGFATNWLPFSVGLGQVARMVDPDQREAQSLWDEARRKTPFVSEGLEVRRDMFGEPIPNSGPLPTYATDPVVKAMEALKVAPGKLTRKIRGIQLTDQQYDEYAMLAGRMTKLQLNSVVALPGFDQMPAAIRIELIHKAISSSREIARSNIMAQDPTIIRRAIQAKIDPLKDQEEDFISRVPEGVQ